MAIAKELMDNALDAGATDVQICMSADEVVCTDNGNGLSRELLGQVLTQRVTTKES